MTSVDNILGLVSHLHSMESSFSAILIEAAMKLASLTDANLFILVETKDGNFSWVEKRMDDLQGSTGCHHAHYFRLIS